MPPSQEPPFAALPMYDWPEARLETDHEWHTLRTALLAEGIPAPLALTRRNADLPSWPADRIRSEAPLFPGSAPDGLLSEDDLDLQAVWRHPCLLLAQTCWGPMERGLDKHVVVVGQPDYSAHEGGDGPRYSSAILMRRGGDDVKCEAGTVGDALPAIRSTRLAYNSGDSMSGFLALERDLEALGESLESVFTERVETGGHRASIRAVAEGRADACAVDCRTWGLARRFEEKAGQVRVVGWTGLRMGLPFVTARGRSEEEVESIRKAVAGVGG